MPSEEVRAELRGNVGVLTLSRPKAIHALTLNMCEVMSAALSEWQSDDAAQAVIVEHGEGRGFCAGGDIALLRKSALEDGGKAGRAFFYTEYQLNYQLFTYPRPVVAFMDGITMGGGVGISQPARFRVATENTRFAMPETGIGLFPDVGGGWYLSRLPGRVGAFLALTGARLDGAECLGLGLATHYLPSAALPDAKARIIAGEDIAAVLDALSVAAPPARIEENRVLIDQHFAGDDTSAVLASLAADSSEWAAKELKTLRGKSPQSCAVSLRQLRESAALVDFADNMAMEYRIASRVLLRPDFAEGVRALIIDKTNDPHWEPSDFDAVDAALLDAIFAPLPADEEWKPL